MPDNPLQTYFDSNDDAFICKWSHYFEIYHRHFERFRQKKPRVLEIGVSYGGSLYMWREYFGTGCKIVGVDVRKECLEAAREDIEIAIGDQADLEFLESLEAKHGPFDIVIDDGGHTMTQLITTFEALYPKLSPYGVYLAEDLHTCYWGEEIGKGYGGGFRKRTTFIEYSKDLIDRINAWHIPEQCLSVNSFTKSTFSLSFYDSVLVVERRPVSKPEILQSGKKLLAL